MISRLNLFFKTSLLFFLVCSVTFSAFAEDLKTINIVTPEWEGQTNKDGTGFFFDIVRSVYEPEIKMNFQIVPWKRAEIMVASGKADAMLCVYKQNIQGLAPKYPIFIDYTAVIFKKDKIKDWKGLESLNGKAAVWLRGYDHHKNSHMKGISLSKWSEVDSYDQGWIMLKKDRIDLYFEALVEIENYIKKNKIDMTPYQMETLWGNNSYMAFSDTEKSKKLIEIFDKKIIELFNSGELKKIFEKWDMPFSADAWK